MIASGRKRMPCIMTSLFRAGSGIHGTLLGRCTFCPCSLSSRRSPYPPLSGIFTSYMRIIYGIMRLFLLLVPLMHLCHLFLKTIRTAKDRLSFLIIFFFIHNFISLYQSIISVRNNLPTILQYIRKIVKSNKCSSHSHSFLFRFFKSSSIHNFLDFSKKIGKI